MSEDLTGSELGIPGKLIGKHESRIIKRVFATLKTIRRALYIFDSFNDVNTIDEDRDQEKKEDHSESDLENPLVNLKTF